MVESFAIRNKITPPPTLQLIDISPRLRNRLWNAFSLNVYKPSFVPIDWLALSPDYVQPRSEDASEVMNRVCLSVIDSLGHDVDAAPSEWGECRSFLQELHGNLDWTDIYYFHELFLQHAEVPSESRERYRVALNRALEDENSGFRVVGNQMSPIASDAEIEEVEAALMDSDNAVENHLLAAIKSLSQSPKSNDACRTAAKEAIAAVESFVRENYDKTSLGEALKDAKNNFPGNPAFIQAMEKLYGYTNSPKTGIRHCLLGDFEEVDFAEAKYFVVCCSAFINYMRCKLTTERIV